MFNLCSSTWPKSQLRADWALFAHPPQQLLAGNTLWIAGVVVGERYPFRSAVPLIDHNDAAVITRKVDRRS
jgi:hypothetical protein